MKLVLAAVVGFLALPAFAQAPPEWTCDPGFFDAGDGCDCSCGVVDPDCPTPAFADCQFKYCEAPTDALDPADPTRCAANAAADGTVGGTEECDDGNMTAGDGCNAAFEVEPGSNCPQFGGPCALVVCGDGVVVGTEECDDSNTVAADGCGSTCAVEDGFACPREGGPCASVPAGWTCLPAFFADAACDCGCGAVDPACATQDPVAIGCTEACCAEIDGPEGCDFVEGCVIADCTIDDDCAPGETCTDGVCGGPGGGEGEGDTGGEGEGEGDTGGEGEGEGDTGGEGEGDAGEGEGEGDTGGCDAEGGAVPSSAAAGLLLLVLSRRRR
jgi:uncharacterized protein (TIGR03382 family)